MKFCETWLREWINPKVNSSVLYEQISNSGFEVESVKKFEPVFNGVVVGKIVKCVLHPQLNKLKVVKVDIGQKKLLNIVCGASNCRNGIKVAVATVGATLPKNIKIGMRTFKKESSEGMLCSFFELGLFYSNDIIEFSYDALIGDSVNKYLLLKDNIIKISITSNRPDGLSILGISRNIAAINNFKIPPLKKKSIAISIQKKINIDIKAEKECFSYFGRIIQNVNTNVDTPFWMKKKLFFSNFLSENVITNIINYVLIELGQPLNVLDSDNINGDIIVRMAMTKEKIILKNDIEISLNKNILVFSDFEKILFLPGNINSYTVDINNNTKNIFLSSLLISKKSISYLIKKINSNKILEYYNYGIDPFLQNYAIEYASSLIIKICGGTAAPIVGKKVNSFVNVKNTIRLFHHKLNKIIGFFLNETIISNILHNLNYEINFQKKFWDVIPPSWRFDIIIEEDVISDILRIYGYNNINLIPLKEDLKCIKKNELTDCLLKKSAIILINQGYYEVINYSFIDPNVQDIIFLNKPKLLISNPISQEMSCMRFSLWPGLLKNVSYNTNRQQQSLRFFEMGFCFAVDKKENLNVKQEMFLSAVISGNYLKENWYDKIRKMDFYDLKGDLESVLESMCELNDIEFRCEIIPGLHPKQSSSIYFRNRFIGSIGAIDPRLEKELNVNNSTFLFEISLNNFPDIKLEKIKNISKFPTIRRDIAILMSENIAVYDILKTCKKFFINKKVEINLFDLYSYKEFSHNKKSLGISFIFQHEKRTLQDNEINLMINNCIKILQKKFQVILRK